MKKILLFVLVIFLTSCVSKERETELNKEIIELKSKLDACKNGADKLHARMKLSYDKSNISNCKYIYKEMETNHPDSPLFSEVKSIYDKIITKEVKEAKEVKRLADIKAKNIKDAIEKENKIKLKALKKLKKKDDDVAGITWYSQPYFTHYTNRFLTSIQIGSTGTGQWLNLMMSYKGDDWIFFEYAYLSYDGNTKNISFNKYDNKETDNGNGSVWEWITISVDKDLEDFLREFAKSKNAKMRFVGKYSKTRTLTRNERQGIIDVLNGYDALKQGIY